MTCLQFRKSVRTHPLSMTRAERAVWVRGLLHHLRECPACIRHLRESETGSGREAARRQLREDLLDPEFVEVANS